MPKSGFSLKKSGRFKTGRDLQGAIEQALGPTLKRGGLILEGGIKGAAPVRTGNLRRSTNTGSPTWKGSVYLVKVGPRAVYAARVNVRGRSRGYIKRGIDGSIGKAKAELKQGAGRFDLSAVWESK